MKLWVRICPYGFSVIGKPKPCVFARPEGKNAENSGKSLRKLDNQASAVSRPLPGDSDGERGERAHRIPATQTGEELLRPRWLMELRRREHSPASVGVCAARSRSRGVCRGLPRCLPIIFIYRNILGKRAPSAHPGVSVGTE